MYPGLFVCGTYVVVLFHSQVLSLTSQRQNLNRQRTPQAELTKTYITAYTEHTAWCNFPQFFSLFPSRTARARGWKGLHILIRVQNLAKAIYLP